MTECTPCSLTMKVLPSNTKITSSRSWPATEGVNLLAQAGINDHGWPVLGGPEGPMVVHAYHSKLPTISGEAAAL